MLMANPSVKKSIAKIYPSYYTFERGLYNTLSAIIGISVLFLWQPITEVTVMNFTSQAVKSLFFVMFCLFCFQGILTIPFMAKMDLIGFKNMRNVIEEEEIEYPQTIKLQFPFIYRGMRHPRLGSILGMMIFSSTDFNLGRIIFLSCFIIGTFIGAILEESYLCEIESYRKYCDIVPNKFIFDVFEALDPENEKKIKNLETHRFESIKQ